MAGAGAQKGPPEGAGVGRKPRRRLSRQREERRRFLRSALLAVALVLLQPFDLLPAIRRLRVRLRPPGALPEDRFLGACIKCGQCVQVCPVEAITLADVGDGIGSGVPYIEPRSQACDFSCDALSCILACPTGALSHDLKVKEEVQMGVARLARPDACLAGRGEGFSGRARGPLFEGRLRYEDVDRWNPLPVAERAYDRDICDLCVIECPIGETALRLEPMLGQSDVLGLSVVVGEGCVGCGVCEMVCPQQPSCIVVDQGKVCSPA
jgi:ferredoxin-type protein NapG